MSFSFSVTEQDVTDHDTMGGTINALCDALPEGPGRDEAMAMSDVITDSVLALVGEDHEFGSASISGSVGSSNGQLSVYVNFKTVSAPPADDA